jgi:hypothetical protein
VHFGVQLRQTHSSNSRWAIARAGVAQRTHTHTPIPLNPDKAPNQLYDRKLWYKFLEFVAQAEEGWVKESLEQLGQEEAVEPSRVWQGRWQRKAAARWGRWRAEAPNACSESSRNSRLLQ